jgi:hypothetical protein
MNLPAPTFPDVRRNRNFVFQWVLNGIPWIQYKLVKFLRKLQNFLRVIVRVWSERAFWGRQRFVVSVTAFFPGKNRIMRDPTDYGRYKLNYTRINPIMRLMCLVGQALASLLRGVTWNLRDSIGTIGNLGMSRDIHCTIGCVDRSQSRRSTGLHSFRKWNITPLK